MKKLLILLMLFAFTPNAFAGEACKENQFAVVDLAKIERDSKKIKKFTEKIGKLRDDFYQKYQKDEKEITKMTEDLKAKSSAISPDQIKKEEAKIQEKIDVYSKEVQKRGKIFELASNMILEKLNKCVIEQVAKVSKSNKCKIAMQSSHVIYYSSDVADITRDVLEEFDDAGCDISVSDTSDYFKKAEKEIENFEKKK